eukprot:m.248979 g.248979  ORF g.248979 m.248979 type:complete len:968 (+) comp15425_c0_seq2:198-3101(+)
MYGVVTIAVAEFLLSLENGEAAWAEVKKRVGLEEDISFYEYYSDDITLSLVNAAAAVTGLSFNDVLRGSADATLKPLVVRGYKPLADSLGASFYECLGHLDIMHQNLVNSYPGMVAPSFRPELVADGTLYLHYHSARPGLWPYAQNLLVAVAKAIYDIDVSFDHYQKKHEGHDHDIFIVNMPPEGFGARDETRLKAAAKKHAKYACDSSTFNLLFPWHLEVDRKLQVVSMGSLLEARMKSELETKQDKLYLSDIIKLKQPAVIKQTFEALRERDRCTFLAVVRDDWYFQKKQMSRDEKQKAKGFKPAVTTPPQVLGFKHESGCPIPFTPKDSGTKLPAPSAEAFSSGCPLPSASVDEPSTRLCKESLAELMAETKPAFDKHAASAIKLTARPSSGSMLQALMTTPGTNPSPITRTVSDTVSKMMRMRRLSDESNTSMSSTEAEAYITEAVGFLFLKGEIAYRKETDTLMLLGNPECSSPSQLYLRGLSLLDLPIHSNMRERLYSAAHQLATVSNAGSLESTTKQLVRAKQDIQKERLRVSELLLSILPKEVAVALEAGENPEAKRFAHVSILFSDIPTFEKIVGSVRPSQVMDLLNEMFSKFDELCKEFDLYKVETVGDSYMVASGIPTPNPYQATKLAKFSVKMMEAANSVVSPIDGNRLTLRIGMHTGNIMAGIVGKTRPRYCLFGDTVNVASRMESTTMPGTIQYSASMMSALMEEKAQVQWVSRGDIDVKGKGLMETFFLLGIEEEQEFLAPPKDAFQIAKPRLSQVLQGLEQDAYNADSTRSPTQTAVINALQHQMASHSQMVEQHLSGLQAQVFQLQLHLAGQKKQKKCQAFYTVYIHRLARSRFSGRGATSVCEGVAHDTHLEDIVDTVLSASEARMKLFTSENCSTLILQNIPIGELVARRSIAVSMSPKHSPVCSGEIHLFAKVEHGPDALEWHAEITILKDLGLLQEQAFQPVASVV